MKIIEERINSEFEKLEAELTRRLEKPLKPGSDHHMFLDREEQELFIKIITLFLDKFHPDEEKQEIEVLGNARSFKIWEDFLLIKHILIAPKITKKNQKRTFGPDFFRAFVREEDKNRRSQEALRDRFKRFLSRFSRKAYLKILKHLRKHGMTGYLYFISDRNSHKLKKITLIDPSHYKRNKDHILLKDEELSSTSSSSSSSDDDDEDVVKQEKTEPDPLKKAVINEVVRIAAPTEEPVKDKEVQKKKATGKLKQIDLFTSLKKRGRPKKAKDIVEEPVQEASYFEKPDKLSLENELLEKPRKIWLGEEKLQKTRMALKVLEESYTPVPFDSEEIFLDAPEPIEVREDFPDVEWNAPQKINEELLMDEKGPSAEGHGVLNGLNAGALGVRDSESLPAPVEKSVVKIELDEGLGGAPVPAKIEEDPIAVKQEVDMKNESERVFGFEITQEIDQPAPLGLNDKLFDLFENVNFCKDPHQFKCFIKGYQQEDSEIEREFIRKNCVVPLSKIFLKEASEISELLEKLSYGLSDLYDYLCEKSEEYVWHEIDDQCLKAVKSAADVKFWLLLRYKEKQRVIRRANFLKLQLKFI